MQSTISSTVAVLSDWSAVEARSHTALIIDVVVVVVFIVFVVKLGLHLLGIGT